MRMTLKRAQEMFGANNIKKVIRLKEGSNKIYVCYAAKSCNNEWCYYDTLKDTCIYLLDNTKESKLYYKYLCNKIKIGSGSDQYDNEVYGCKTYEDFQVCFNNMKRIHQKLIAWT